MRSASRQGLVGPAHPARLGWSLLLVIAVVVVAGQLLPHARNVSPVRAAALFAGAHFASPAAALAVPLGAHLLGAAGVGLASGDWSYGFHALAPVVYGSFALNVLLGLALRSRRRAAPVAAATVAGSLGFFLITNFAVWLVLGTYPRTPEGLALCYAAGLPFLWNGLLGDAAWAALLFGGYALARRTASAVAGRGLA
jgi:hypothetical protein